MNFWTKKFEQLLEEKSVRHQWSGSYVTPDMTSPSSDELSPARDLNAAFVGKQIDPQSEFGQKIVAATRK